MAEQKIMTRIMKLMERANHQETPDAEAVSCMEMAEKLMAQHMIDRADLKPENTSKIVQDHWDLMWNAVDESSFRYYMKDMMETVLEHCGIRVHPQTTTPKDDEGRLDYSRKRFTVVGFPEDMMYAEQIWFRVFREFVSNINPQWDNAKPLQENVYAMARAGMSWGDIHKAAEKSGVEYGLPALLNGGGAKLRNLYRAECEKRGEEYSKTRTHDAYRTTFVRSYGSTIAQRLRQMRENAKETISDSDKYALALRTTKKRVDEEFYRLFPEFDPELRARMKAAEAAQAVEDFLNMTPEEQAYVIAHVAEAEAKAQREYASWVKRQSRARRNYGAVRERVTHDEAAWQHGRNVGNKVNLNVDPEVKRQKKGEIGG